MNIIDINSNEDLSSIVFDAESQRLINNANTAFAVYVRFSELQIERVSGSSVTAVISQSEYDNVVRFNDRILDIVNNSPSFGKNDESVEFSLLPSLVRVNSSGQHLIRFTVDSNSFFFTVNENDHEAIDFKTLNKSKQIDTVVRIDLQFYDSPEIQVVAIVEEARISDFVPKPEKPVKRRPVLL